MSPRISLRSMRATPFLKIHFGSQGAPTRTDGTMNIQSALAACRNEIALLVKSIIRLLWWVLIFNLAVSSVYGLLQAHRIFSLQTMVACAFMFVSLVAAFGSAKSRTPGRKTWIGVHVGIFSAGIAAVFWVPQWSGYIVGTTLVLFVFTPNLLRQLAFRRAAAGYDRAAAFYGRLACLVQPSRQVRFDSSFLIARALGSIKEKVAAYREMARRATPEQWALVNCWISSAQGDWEGVLEQIRRAGDTLSELKWLEIRALGELGRVDEMIASYASAESVLSATNLPFCRLFVLAFSGRADAVHSLLGRQLRFLSPRMKSYWVFIVSQAAGNDQEEARRVLGSYARSADDETFCKTAQRHLDAGPKPGGAILSAESRAIIAVIEGHCEKRNGLRADTIAL